MYTTQKYEMLYEKDEGYLFSLTREEDGENTPMYTIETRMHVSDEPDSISLFPREMMALLKIIDKNDLDPIIEKDFEIHDLPYHRDLFGEDL